jgi:hypothetical protein
MRRGAEIAGWLAATLLVVRAASAGEAQTALETSVAEVIAAARAGDREALRRIAETNPPDPWIVAERVLQRDETTAARALATAVGARIRDDVRLARHRREHTDAALQPQRTRARGVCPVVC